MTEIIRIRQSEFTSFDDCRRKWNLQYVEGWRRNPTTPEGVLRAPSTRDVGTMAHAYLQGYYLGESHEQSLLRLYEKITEITGIEAGEVDEFEHEDEWRKQIALALHMVEGYVDWVEGEGLDSGFQVVGVEKEWTKQFPLLLPYTSEEVIVEVYGQIDLLGFDEMDSMLHVVDFKSVATHEAPHDADFQLRTYSWAVDGGELRVGAPRHRQLRRVSRSGRAKAPFFMQHSVPYNKLIAQQHVAHLAARALDIVNLKRYAQGAEASTLYPSPSRDCSWKCDFLDICPLVDEGAHDDALASGYHKAPEQ